MFSSAFAMDTQKSCLTITNNHYGAAVNETSPAPSRDTFSPGQFLFRGLHPCIRMGTASDRYAGWIGQIYPERYWDRITTRVHTVGGKTFKEQVLPIESVKEYFRHFSVLELDSTFYSLLLDEDMKPTPVHRLLRRYREHLLEGDRLILKVPQVICAQKLLRRGRYEANPDCLNPALFTRRFLDPALELLGEKIAAFVFEQEYTKQGEDRVSPSQFASMMEGFFGEIPPDSRYHMEVRTEAFLRAPYLDVLEKFGVGQVLSHWTWLPPLRRQFRRGGQKFRNSGASAVVRLMTPLGVRYEEAYKMSYPFDREVDGMMSPGMTEETAEIMLAAVNKEVTLHVIINNRAGGNAPLIAQEISRRFSEIAAHGDALP
jgi:uncharacterized protein YecE (DUF72 family)